MPSSPNSTIARVPPEHRQKLETPLSAASSAALQTMFSAGLLRPVLQRETADALVNAGYIREGLGGHAMTDVGRVRAMMESAT